MKQQKRYILKKKLSFDSFPSLVGKIQDNGMEIIMNGPDIDEIKTYLTARNHSAAYQLTLAEKRRVFDEESAISRREEIAKLEELLIKEYYADTPQGLSVPVGFWYLCANITGHENTEISSSHLPDFLRPYQKEDVIAALKYKRAVVCAATGLGKSLEILALAMCAIKASKRVCIIVPTIDLVSQTLKVCQAKNVECCGAGGSHFYRPGTPLLVTTIDSAYKYIDVFDTICLDECLPYYERVVTSIGAVRIGALWRKQDLHEILPLVRTWNEKLECWEWKRIKRVIKARDRELLREIKLCNRKFTCTVEHPLYTTQGWKQAKDIKQGDVLLGSFGDHLEYSPNLAKYLVTGAKNKYYRKGRYSTPKGLYDLEVEDNHNFCVTWKKNQRASILVHNCHHSPASTWFNLLATAVRATHVYGFSATPFRSDGMDLGIHAWCGPVIVNRTAAWGIANGWLARPDIYMIRIVGLPYVSSKKMAAIAYKKLAHHVLVHQFLLRKIKSGLAAGKVIMVIFNTVLAGKAFQVYCKGQLDFDVAHAGYRLPFLQYKAGKTNLLVGNVKLFGEGVDVPRTDCIITLCNNRSEIITRQVIGRAMRISPGKKNAIVLDVWFDNYEPYVKARNSRVEAYTTVVETIKEISV
jgi:superfamily II DNA or RNA helicase